MNIDNNLFDNLNSNTNLNSNQKEMLYSFLIKIKKDIFDPYIEGYNFDNVLPLIKSLKVSEGSETDIIRYDKLSNTLVLGKSPKNQEFNTYKSLLNLICQSYDEEDNKYNSGLIVTIDGKEYGTKLNDLLTDYLITINTGLFNKEDSNE